jgi:S-adenosylmethionine uptake transporter
MPVRLSLPQKPLFFALAGVAAFAVMDAVMKGLATDIGAYNAIFWRQIVGVMLSGAAFLIGRKAFPEKKALAVHAQRGAFGGIMAFIYFWGLTKVPLAEATALSFIAPLIALFLAALILGEKISRNAVIGSLLGFGGICVIIFQQSQAGLSEGRSWLGIAAILISAALYAYNLILQRQQALLAEPVEAVFFTNLFACITLGVAAPFLGIIPAVIHWPDIGVSAGLAVAALLMLSWAYGRAEAQRLVPLEYTGFVWAAILGWLLFGESVSGWTVAGTLLIILGCALAARETKVA